MSFTNFVNRPAINVVQGMVQHMDGTKLDDAMLFSATWHSGNWNLACWMFDS